jgi:chitinase
LNNFIFKDPEKHFVCEKTRHRECCSGCTNVGCLGDCDRTDACGKTLKQPGPCPRHAPERDPLSSAPNGNGEYYWSFKDEGAKSAFYSDLATEKGIEKDWINEDQTIWGGYKGMGYQGAGVTKPEDYFQYWYGYFSTKTDINIPNPKDMIGKAMDQYEEIASKINGAALEVQISLHEEFTGTYVDAVSTPVLMAQSAVSAMQAAADKGEKLQEDQRKEQILRIVGAVLFFVLFIGESVDGLGFAVLARIISIGGDLADEVFNLYGIVDDPASGLFALFGTVAKVRSWEKAAAIRRGLKDLEVKALGKDVNDGLGKIDDMKGRSVRFDEGAGQCSADIGI